MASGLQAGNADEIDRLALALAKDPRSKAFIPLAEEYGKSGMWVEAAGVLEDGLNQYPRFITAMVALGRAYDQIGQLTKAKAILEEAVKMSPENLRAHRTLAKIYAAEGATEAALRSGNVILAANPSDQEALSLCASLGAAEKPNQKSNIGGHVQPNAEKAVEDIPAPVMVHEFILASSEVADIQSQPILQEVDITGVDPVIPVETRVAPGAVFDNQTGPILLAEAASIIDLVLQGNVPVRPEPTPAAAQVPPPGHRQATVLKLEQWLGTIHARRRDRPSTGQTVQIS